MTRFYKNPKHRYYAGVDLHARSMYVCILDQQDNTVFHLILHADAKVFLETLAPYRYGLVAAAECMFAWYWLADLCQDWHVPFVLGHALAIKAIHYGKTKNDKHDSLTLATLFRGGNFPPAYVYPRGMRETRDLLRRRCVLIR